MQLAEITTIKIQDLVNENVLIIGPVTSGKTRTLNQLLNAVAFDNSNVGIVKFESCKNIETTLIGFLDIIFDAISKRLLVKQSMLSTPRFNKMLVVFDDFQKVNNFLESSENKELVNDCKMMFNTLINVGKSVNVNVAIATLNETNSFLINGSVKTSLTEFKL